MTLEQYCQQKAAQRSSFYYSFSSAAAATRAITALYAFAARSTISSTRRPLPASNSPVARGNRPSVRQRAAASVARALATSIKEFNLPRDSRNHRRHGNGSRLRQLSSFKELSLYCHRVASMVGIMSAKSSATRTAAHRAAPSQHRLQLTNILRDVRGDAMRADSTSARRAGTLRRRYR